MMSEKDFEVFDLEVHETKNITDSHVNGELTVVWRDWDNLINNPKMVYVNTVNPGEIKGPHVHKNRISYFYCIEGEMITIVQDKDGQFHEIRIHSGESKLVSVSNGIAAAIVNPSNKISKILVLADVAWKPNDNEMDNVEFKNYNFDKWKL
tara:strand:+ start:430 stop:882 length:453 start_codon:yes stop_codon:yes gene_type:complete